MSGSMVIGYFFLFIFLVAIIVIARRSRQKRMETGSRYNEIMVPLEKKIREAMDERNAAVTAAHRFVTSDGNGIIVAIDGSNRLAAIAMEDSLEIFRFDDIIGVEAAEEKSGRQVSSVEVRLSLSGKGTYRYIFSDKPFRSGNYIGEILRTHAAEMASVLNAARDSH